MRIFAVIILCLTITLSSSACARAGESPSPSPSPTPKISITPAPTPSPAVSATPAAPTRLPATTPAPTATAEPTPEPTPEPTIQPSPPVYSPSPVVRDMDYYSSVSKAKSVFGASLKYPSLWPQDFYEKYVAIVNKNMFELVYSKGDNELVYRVKEGSSNISGDFYVYEKVDVTDIGGVSVIIKSNGGVAFLALWESDNYSYSLRADKGLPPSDMENVIASVK